MSVQTEIDRISTAVQNAHLKVIEKGGTSAAPYLVANLADAIDTIPEATAGEDVTAETNAYTSLLSDLEAAVDALPDAGSGGSGGVETCELTINYVTNYGLMFNCMAYIAVDNDGVIPVVVDYAASSNGYIGGSTTTTINVLRNSMVEVTYDSMDGIGAIERTDGITYLPTFHGSGRCLVFVGDSAAETLTIMA